MRKRSCPAVSQICSFTVFPSSSSVRIFCKWTAVCMAGQSQKRSKRTDKQAEQMPVSVSLSSNVTSNRDFDVFTTLPACILDLPNLTVGNKQSDNR